MKQIMNKYKNIIYIGIIFIVIFIMSYYCHYDADDYNYAHIPWTTEKVTGISSIIRSQIIMYHSWSGRVLFSGLGQMFMFGNKLVYALLNSAIFILLIMFITSFFQKYKKNKLSVLIITFSCIWIFTPVFVENFIWLSGSVNYLWTVFVTILFMSFFYKKYILDGAILKYSLIPLAIITGISHEITIFVSGSFIFFTVLFNIKYFFEKIKNKDLEFILTLLVYLASVTFCLFAPGNFLRASGGLKFNLIPIIENFLYIKYLIVILFVCLIYQFIYNRKKMYKYFKYIILPIGLSLIPMTFLPDFSLRVMLIYVILFIIIICDTSIDIVNKYRFLNDNFLEIVLAIISLYHPIYVANYYSMEMKKYNEEIEFAVNYGKYTGNNDLIINQLKVPSETTGKYTLSSGHRATAFKNSIYSQYFCNYYGCNSIVAKQKENVIITIISDDKVRLKCNNKIINRIEPSLLVDSSNSNITYVFEIPRSCIDNFEIITTKNTISSIEIRDIDYYKKYNKEKFNRILEKDR